jgi:Na+-driven multidrug efflux pump
VAPPPALYAEQQDCSPPLAPPTAAKIVDGPLRPAILRAAGVAQFGMAFENVLEGALTGAGYTLYTMIAVVVISALRIPLADAVAGPYGLAGIWWMLALTAMARAAAMASLWQWGGWEKARA